MYLIRPLAPAIAIGLLFGCATPLTDDNAPDVSAKVFCKKHRSCETDAWTDTYDADMATCRDELADDFDDLRDAMDLLGFDLDLEELRNCLDDVKDTTCQDFEQGDLGNDCPDVFTF